MEFKRSDESMNKRSAAPTSMDLVPTGSRTCSIASKSSSTQQSSTHQGRLPTFVPTQSPEILPSRSGSSTCISTASHGSPQRQTDAVADRDGSVVMGVGEGSPGMAMMEYLWELDSDDEQFFLSWPPRPRSPAATPRPRSRASPATGPPKKRTRFLEFDRRGEPHELAPEPEGLDWEDAIDDYIRHLAGENTQRSLFFGAGKRKGTKLTRKMKLNMTLRDKYHNSNPGPIPKDYPWLPRRWGTPAEVRWYEDIRYQCGCVVAAGCTCNNWNLKFSRDSS